MDIKCSLASVGNVRGSSHQSVPKDVAILTTL